MGKNSTRHYARIPAQRAADIADLAESIADHYCPELPVSPEVILRSKSITTSFNDYGDTFDGLLEQKDGRFHVYCNLARVEAKGSPRARFTLGHELGHYFIDEHRNALLAGTPPHESQTDFSSANPVEAEADLFASCLLMPRRRFLTASVRVADTLRGVIDLSARFATSITSTAVRYASLGVQPCAVVRWTAEGFSWKWLSPQMHRNQMWKTIEEVGSVPDDSPTGRVLRGQSAPGDPIAAGTTAAAWFPFVAPGSPRDVLLMEHAVSLGRFGVLTMIFPLDGALS